MKPHPKQRYSSRTGKPICRVCGKGYGSTYDGLCFHCRGCTAWRAKQKDKNHAD